MSLSKVRKAILTQFTEVDLTHNPFGFFSFYTALWITAEDTDVYLLCVYCAFFSFFNAMLMGCDTKYET